MKAFKVVYKHGHFIDKETNQRLIPVQDSEYTITAANDAFKSEDAKLKISKSLDPKEKVAWIEKKYAKTLYAKLLNAGTQLFFRVGNSRKVEGDESSEYILVCSLLEDLYLYKLSSHKGDSVIDWRLADCKCALVECLLGGLTLSEKLQASSVNKLFSQTVMFYFPLQRSGSCDAFNTFFIYKRGMKISHYSAIHELHDGLGSLRKEFIAARNKKVSK